MASRSQLRSFLACLCLALLLFAVFAPAATGLLFAVLIPLIYAVAVRSEIFSRPLQVQKPRPLAYLSPWLSRPPPRSLTVAAR